MNNVVVDAKVQPDTKVFDEIANFNVSILSGYFVMPNGYHKNRYTFIRVIYNGEITDTVKKLIQPGNFVRLYGKLDSEHYCSKSGKTVYNKVLVIDRIAPIRFNKELQEYEEVK